MHEKARAMMQWPATIFFQEHFVKMRILSRLSFLVAISFASLLLIEAVDYPPLRDALHVPYPASPNPQILRIGFIGDTGVNIQAERNLLWLKNRANVDAIVHVGDFAYELDGAAKFREMTEGTLGDKFPYFTVSGDHDLYEFDDYRDFFVGRDLKTPGADCRGVWGVKSVCRFKVTNLRIILFFQNRFS